MYEEWVAKHLGVAGIKQQNGLVEETNMTLLAKGDKFEVEPLGDHTFEVEPPGNVGKVASSQKVQTQNFIGYHSARDREQHSTRELFRYREDSNEVAFVVAKAKKIYAHESLNFNDTVACEVISKWKDGFKEEMHDRLDVYVFSNGCRKNSDDRNDYKAKETVLGVEIFRDQSRNTLRVSQSSCSDVGMLDGFDRGLQIDVQVFMDFFYAMGRSITVMDRLIAGYTLMIHECAVGWEAKLQHMWVLSTTEAE
ncbi:hypothetical protein Tco_0422045 [Tanacetum coccineum]